MSTLVVFLTGFLQVFLVATNTRQVSQGHLMGSAIVGFGISAVWAYNVHHIAISGMVDGLIYALGASCGTVSGIVATRWWYQT